MAALAGEFILPLNPANSLVQTATRTWTDANGNFIPDCVLENVEANGECGTIDNKKFGSVNITTRFSPETISGFGNREYTWQSAVTLQHELRPGFGVTAAYFRSWFGNFTVIDNLAVTLPASRRRRYGRPRRQPCAWALGHSQIPRSAAPPERAWRVGLRRPQRCSDLEVI